MKVVRPPQANVFSTNNTFLPIMFGLWLKIRSYCICYGTEHIRYGTELSVMGLKKWYQWKEMTIKLEVFLHKFKIFFVVFTLVVLNYHSKSTFVLIFPLFHIYPCRYWSCRDWVKMWLLLIFFKIDYTRQAWPWHVVYGS